MPLQHFQERELVTEEKLAIPVRAGQVVALSKLIDSYLPDAWASWRGVRAITVGRLAADATTLAEIDFDLFITEIDNTSPGPSWEEPDRRADPKTRIVGGTGTPNLFNLSSPVDYLDLKQQAFSQGQPGYQMDRPTDFPPTVKIEEWPVALLRGDRADTELFRLLSLVKSTQNFDRIVRQGPTGYRTIDHYEHFLKKALPRYFAEQRRRANVLEVLSHSGSGLMDLFFQLDVESIFPQEQFPELYDPTRDDVTIQSLCVAEA